MGVRYLSQSNVRDRLKNGCAIEQWLGSRIDGEDRLIKWMRIHKNRHGGYGVTRFEAYDQGGGAVNDIYEFSSYDPDEPYGSLSEFDDWKSALEYAIRELGADGEKFVNNGVVQDEYYDFVEREGKWPVSNR